MTEFLDRPVMMCFCMIGNCVRQAAEVSENAIFIKNKTGFRRKGGNCDGFNGNG